MEIALENQEVQHQTLGDSFSAKEDPRYQQALAHFQNGAWQEAIRCLEELARDHPDCQSVQEALQEARFKASLSAKVRIRGTRRVLPARTVIFRSLLILILLAIVVEAGLLVRRRIAPFMAQMQAEQRHARWLANGQALLATGNLDAAEETFKKLLAEVPDQPEGLQGLAEVQAQRELLAWYQEAVALQREGNYEQALARFSQISLKAPRYRDVGSRITQIERQLDLDRRYALAQEAEQAGRLAEALLQYQQLTEMEPTYRSADIAARQVALYLKMAAAIIEHQPPMPEEVPQALEYYERALVLQPRNTEAMLGQRLARTYLEGLAAYKMGKWEEAARKLQAVYEQRRDYLGTTVVFMLFNTYIYIGDQYREANARQLAYEQYTKALALDLPGLDKAVARARAESVAPKGALALAPSPTLTATALSAPPVPVTDWLGTKPTETITPTPASTLTFTPTAGATRVPTATPTRIPTATPTALPTRALTSTPKPTRVPPTPLPAQPLAAYRGWIVFFSAQKGGEGLWIMDSQGQNRRYLGDSADCIKEYEALAAQARRSPDGHFDLTVQKVGSASQVFISPLKHERYGELPSVQLTRFDASSYDPVWSPDGGRVAFVSREGGSEDIWVISADGSNALNLTKSKGTEGHPSWGPGGSRIVFWASRSGRKQIYVMDADGRNVRNLSNSDWDEYDPLWIGSGVTLTASAVPTENKPSSSEN
jgi:tetratricopeptide (TPR) repeat protein